ncbi:MAG: TraR/DksA family transcriptional regulator [Salinarimonadaceae bacterium]|nr:MAG: TraR/DksA family transcriptional regulator [Salinarimonadaceae bacterium]
MENDPEDLVAYFRPRIEVELAELEGDSRATDEDRRPVELDQQSVGRLSRMDAMQMQAIAAAVERRRRMRLVGLDQALRRMEAGEYGYCLDCGEFIGRRRLEIDPAAPKCVRCA